MGTVAPAAAILVLQSLLWPVGLGVVLRGATIGLLTALIAVGMALVYRANRVVNFAQADLGYVPALLGVMLVAITGVNYFVGLLAGLASAVLLGAIVELAVIRRFFRSARLILTVATIGLSQILAAGALFLAEAWDAPSRSQRIDIPWSFTFEVDPLIFEADYVVAWVVGPLAMLGVGSFLRFTLLGTAIRGAADSADRAGLLGVPVKRLHTVVWAVASTLAFVGIWLQAGIIGLPIGTALTFGVLLRALAALMMGNLTNLPAIALSAVALGVLETAVDFNASSIGESKAILAAVIIVTLLVRSLLDRSDSRVDRDATSTWQAAEEVRPVPKELRAVTEVQVVRGAIAAVIAVAALVLPHLLDTDQSLKASAVVIFGIIGVSVVVLTGWSGQVSLGQMAFVAFGAAVTAKLTHEWQVDLILALAASATVGAAVAVVVGLPALRQRGLFLAVTSLAFSLATTSYFLNENFFSWVHDNRFERVPLFGRIDLDTPTRMYYLALAGLGLVLVALRGVRRTRTGRVLLALRENEQATQTYGVSTLWAKLTGFALSGAVAAFAGGLFAYHQHAFDPVSYAPARSIDVFTMGVIGGLGTLAGGVFGAVYLRGIRWFLPGEWVFLASGAGVMLVLLVVPSGIGGLVFRLRDLWLRWVARRRGLIVPSLLADVQPTAAEEEALIDELESRGARGAAPTDEPVGVGEEP